MKRLLSIVAMFGLVLFLGFTAPAMAGDLIENPFSGHVLSTKSGGYTYEFYGFECGNSFANLYLEDEGCYAQIRVRMVQNFRGTYPFSIVLGEEAMLAGFELRKVGECLAGLFIPGTEEMVMMFDVK